jgi:pimeloyl-ACP methyl ester carboxylesterase
MTISRHFATLGGRQIHYRRAGAGPAVLLLHQTPTSSGELLPLMRHLAPRFTVIAPDMPGYGASDALGDTPPSIEVLADDLAAFMQEIGLESAAVYGFHTGASIATSLARRHPQRVVMTICEGLLCLDAGERRDFDRYIEPFEPRWDGGHLAWLWTRIKDQSLFFPWHERTASSRLAIDGTPADALALRALDWLRAGARYWHGYAAAFAYDPRADLPFIATPHHVLCQRGDPLGAHVARLPPLPAGSLQVWVGSAAEGRDRVLALLAGHAHGAPTPAPAAARAIDGAAWQDYVTASGAQVRILRSGGADAPSGASTVVLQHDAGSSVRACAALAAALGRSRPTLAIESPGHGETELPDGCEIESLAALARRSTAALECLGVTRVDWVGIGAGAALQVHLAREWADRTRSLTLIAPIDVTREPDLQRNLLARTSAPVADSHGGYLQSAWHQVRDALLFFPWYERRRAFAVAASPRLAPEFLQARTRDLLIAGAAGAALARAELGCALADELGALTVTPRIAAPRWEPRHAHAQALAGSRCPFLSLPDEPGDWALHLNEPAP